MPKQKQKQNDVHQPVLLKEVIDVLAPKPGQSYLDLTAGYGGHSAAVFDLTGTDMGSVLVDRDEQAIAALSQRFSDQDVEIRHTDFLKALGDLAAEGRRFDMVLADLGVSSPHMDDAARGFAFSHPGPLDMRMDRRQQRQAYDLVNDLPEAELASILKGYGEEPRSKQIAAAIVANRPVKDTAELAAIISKNAGFRSRHQRTHPATRSFQSLRIAVNDELTQLEQALPLMAEVLAPGGRLAVISFHSLEDRLVKNFIAEHSGDRYDAQLQSLTRRPITASTDELVSNPRARSAKLRAAAKIKTKQKG